MANETGGTRGTLFMNFLSGSGGVLPFFVVSGHATHGTGAARLVTGKVGNTWPDFPRSGGFLGIRAILFEGTNILAAQRIGRDKEFNLYVGFIFADFPGKDLISAIVSLNS